MRAAQPSSFQAVFAIYTIHDMVLRYCIGSERKQPCIQCGFHIEQRTAAQGLIARDFIFLNVAPMSSDKIVQFRMALRTHVSTAEGAVHTESARVIHFHDGEGL